MLLIYNVVGYKCEQHNNPADFFLDIVVSCESQGMKGKQKLRIRLVVMIYIVLPARPSSFVLDMIKLLQRK